MDIRVGTILRVEDIAGKDKLYRIEVDTGDESPRVIVSGLKQVYSKESLQGKQIIVLCNLQSRKLAGILSNGMLLAVGDGEVFLSLLGVDKPAPSGSAVE